MKIQKTKIPGCYEINPVRHIDYRGSFTKTFHKDSYERLGLETNFTEEYYTISHKDVLRGLHFQTPPMDHTKLVYCVFGEVMDVVVDIRIGSPTYGGYEIFELSAEKGNILYIPEGLAHGFCVISNSAIMMYKVTTTYSPEHDTGLLWDSVGISWPIQKPIISERDSKFPTLKEFNSPFIFRGESGNGF